MSIGKRTLNDSGNCSHGDEIEAYKQTKRIKWKILSFKSSLKRILIAFNVESCTKTHALYKIYNKGFKINVCLISNKYFWKKVKV